MIYGHVRLGDDGDLFAKVDFYGPTENGLSACGSIDGPLPVIRKALQDTLREIDKEVGEIDAKARKAEAALLARAKQIGDEPVPDELVEDVTGARA